MVHSAASGSVPGCDAGKTEVGRHTPGPWSVPHFAKPDVNCECGYVLTDGYMGAICTVHASGEGEDEWAHGDNPRFEEACANARLIAAAPELLAAAIKSHEPYEGLSDQDVIDLYGGREAELCFALRAAIAKALGTEA